MSELKVTNESRTIVEKGNVKIIQDTQFPCGFSLVFKVRNYPYTTTPMTWNDLHDLRDAVDAMLSQDL